MQVDSLAIPDVKVLTPRVFADDRGSFSETFSQRVFAEAIGAGAAGLAFVQDNQSVSRAPGTIRGLHYQAPPFAQGKLVRVLAGRIFDVAVDVRRGSATYGRWVGVELSAEQGNQLWVPPGFLHGFATLGPEVVVAYKVTAYYDKASDGSVLWCDPDLAIDWPVEREAAKLSEKDAAAEPFARFDTPFTAPA